MLPIWSSTCLLERIWFLRQLSSVFFSASVRRGVFLIHLSETSASSNAGVLGTCASWNRFS